MVTAAPGRSLDPSKVKARLDDAGLTAAWIEATVHGSVSRISDGVVGLTVPDLPAGLALAGGPQFATLARDVKPGATIIVTGRLHPQRAHDLAGAPAGLTVEKFQLGQ